LEALPERNAKTPTPVSPAYYDGYLARRWAEGCAVTRRLFTEIHRLGFTGCYTHLARFIASWRCAAEPEEKRQMANPVVVLPHDPIAGRLLTPQIASALCVKPRAQLTPSQATVVDTLKVSSPDFAVTRQLAMRFRGFLRSQDVAKLDAWLTDAYHSGINGCIALHEPFRAT
jgi:hypothetical protein